MDFDRSALDPHDVGGPSPSSPAEDPGSTSPPERPARLQPVDTIADVAKNIELVLEWSISAHSTIGYFAALYKRITIAIGEAIDDGVFDDGPRMERLDVAFARRYFEALNSYFYPEDGGTPTLPWEVAFVGDRRNDKRSTMLQHMLTGVNAHITFDLGLAAVAIASDALAPLEGDFNRVNAVLCSQIPGMLDVVEHLSPAVRDIRRVVPAEVLLLKRMLVKLRTSAWYFALATALRPQHARETRVGQESWTSAIGTWYAQPPFRLTAYPVLMRAIAKRESRDVAANIRALAAITDSPVKMSSAYL